MKQPDVYLFNPTCEYAVANGNNSWQPNRILQKMERDLATLPMFFAQQDDVVLVDQLPSLKFLETFKTIGLKLPKFTVKKEILNPEKSINNSFNKLTPWGWSPAAHKLLSPIKQNCSAEFKNSPVISWTPEHRDLYSKKFALKILKKLLSTIDCDFFISEDLLPEICTTQKQFEELLVRWGKLMVKAPWSSSGRGLQPITKTPVHEKVWEKLLGFINDQGYTITEPFLNKVADLALQFEIKKGKISFLGTSNFSADKKGQYLGNFLNGLPETFSENIKDFINQVPKIIVVPLIEILESSEMAKLYEGNFGVDILIFYDENNRLKMNPCLEINVRQNMGLLSLKLEKLIKNEKRGIFKMYYNPEQSFLMFKNEMEKTHPLQISSQKIESGFLPLTQATHNSLFGAYLLI